MIVNRFTQLPVAQYNPMSMEELAFAPTFLRQRHDAAQQGLADLDQASNEADVLDLYITHANQLVQPLQKNISALAEQLASQGVQRSQAIPQAMKLKSEYQKLFGQQGGVGQLQSLKQQFTAAQEELSKRKDLQSNPEVLDYAMKQLRGGLPNLEVQNGKLVGEARIGTPFISRIFDVKERQEMYNNVLNNIQNDEKFAGYGITSLDDVSKLLQQGSIEYKDVNTIMGSMIASLPEELIQSESTRLLANGYTPEEVKEIFNKPNAEQVITIDAKGNLKTTIEYNTKNPIVREMLGFASSRSVNREKTRVTQFTDAKRLADYNKKLEDKVGGYDLPDQVVTVKNSWMEGITDGKSLDNSINSIEAQLLEETNRANAIGMNVNELPYYQELQKRKVYLENIRSKSQNMTTEIEKTEKFKQLANTYGIDLIEKYNVTGLSQMRNPELLAELNLPTNATFDKILDALEARQMFGDPSATNALPKSNKNFNKKRQELFEVIDSVNKKNKQKSNNLNKAIIESEFRNLSTGFTRETSKSAIQAKDDYIEAAFTNLVFVDPNTGEEIAGKDEERLKELGITPETISYSSHSKTPGMDGDFFWKVNTSERDDKGNIKPGTSKSLLVKAPQQFNIEKAAMDLESAVKNPLMNVKLAEQQFYAVVADAEAKNLEKLPLGADRGDLYIGSKNGIDLPTNIAAILVLPNGEEVRITNMTEVAVYLQMLGQYE